MFRVIRDEGAHGNARWLSGWGNEFPPSATFPAHVDANFFRTDLAQPYHWDGSSWQLGEAGEGGGGATVVTREADGAPSVVASILTFDQSDGLVVTDMGGGEARIDLAAIPEARLALNFATHSNANDPSAGEKAALAGTFGTPGAGNKYVTDTDPRLGSTRRWAFMFGGD